MSRPSTPSTSLPVLPAIMMAVLCMGAAIHGNPTLLRPALALAHSLPHLI